MTYARIDDRFDDHPKYVEYGAAEMGLISCAITYANRNHTDGRVPRVWPERRFGKEGAKVATTLVKDNVWRQLEDGSFEIVGFLDHNPSRSEIATKLAADRDRKATAGRRGGQASGERRRDGRRSDSARTDDRIPDGIQTSSEALSTPLLSTPDPPQPPLGADDGILADQLESSTAMKAAGMNPLPASERTAWGDHWANVYQAAVREASGDTGWTFSKLELRTLERVLSARVPSADRHDLPAWIRAQAARFARAVRAKAGMYSAYQPKGFERWWNLDCPTETASSAPAAAALPRSAAYKRLGSGSPPPTASPPADAPMPPPRAAAVGRS